ncbi:MAG: hypothetical protein R2687_01085 [Candidatus Nanopelagicales bacterium]
MRAGLTPAIGSSSMIMSGSTIRARAISSSLRLPAGQGSGQIVLLLSSS